MSTFAQREAASRRLFILRLLTEGGREANESNLYRFTQAGGFPLITRDHIRADLDLLREARCTTEDYLSATLCVVKLTRRGEDVAYGRVEVEGVEASVWER